MSLRYMTLFPVLVFGLLAARTGKTSPPPVLTLEEAIQFGLERSVVLANAERDLRAAQQEFIAVRAEALPSIDVHASYTRFNEVDTPPAIPGLGDAFGSVSRPNAYAASVDAEQLLYAGGSVRAALRFAEDFKEVATLERDRVEADLRRRIIQGFYEVLFREREQEVAAQTIQQWEAFTDQARRRYEAQTASEFEFLSAQVTLANERPAYIAASNALVLARRAFRDLILIDDPDFVLDGDLADELAWPDLETLVDHALDARPELRQLQSQYRMANEERRITVGRYRPELRAFASYGGSDPSARDLFADGWEWEWRAGVRLQWTGFDGGRRRATLRQNDLQIAALQDTLEDQRRNVALEVESIWLTLQEFDEIRRGTADNVGLAQRALDIVTVRYEQGLATHLEFTDSQLALNKAQLNHYRTLMGLHHAWADLMYATSYDEKENH